jgi:glutaredoxin-like protein
MKKIILVGISILLIVAIFGCDGKEEKTTKTDKPATEAEVSAKPATERKFIDPKTSTIVKEKFQNLEKPVEIIFFTQEFECKFCQDTRQLITEVASFSDKVDLVVYDFVQDKTVADDLGVDKIPATVIKEKGGASKGIRFFGIPAGYEFATFLDAVEMVSTGKHVLSDKAVAELDKINKPVHIQVFVTPT